MAVDWNFIIESLNWARKGYEEKAQKYFDIPHYKETTYQPTLKRFEKAVSDLTKLKQLLKGASK